MKLTYMIILTMRKVKDQMDKVDMTYTMIITVATIVICSVLHMTLAHV